MKGSDFILILFVASEMKAATINKYGDQSVLTDGDIERPKPGSDEILVRNSAVAANPVACEIRNGLGEMFRLHLPIVSRLRNGRHD
jgi:NADPH:quinone reductase-like Zn-dependent oxidoreductase